MLMADGDVKLENGPVGGGSSFLMDLAKTGAGALINGVGSYLSMKAQSAEQRKMLDYQWEKMYSPQAQVRNLTSAGVNPAVAFGNQSPVLNSGGQLGSIQPPTFGIGTTSLSDLANYIKAKADARKVGAETIGKEMENELLKNTFKEQVEKIGLDNKWTKEQIAKTTQEVGLMSGQFNEVQQRIENMRSEKALTDKQVGWFDRHMSAEIEDLKQSAEYKKAMAGLTDSQKQLLDDTMEDLKSITGYQSQQMSKMVDLLGKYGDATAIVGLLSQVVGSASDLINSIGGLKNLKGVQEVLSTSTTTDSKGNTKVTNTHTTKK